MKVLAIAQTLKPQSGWGRYTASVVAEYEKQGIGYTVVTADPKEKTGKEAAILKKPDLGGFFQNMFTVRALAKDCDIVHAYDLWPFAVYGYFATIGTNKKLFITAVGTYTIAPFDSMMKRLLLTPACHAAQTIFSIGNYTKKRLLEKIQLSNVITVFWGTSVLTVMPEGERASYYKEFNIPEGASPVLLTVGQIKHRKGQLDTARAVAALKKTYPNILYLIVGSDDDANYVNEIQALIAEKKLENNIRIIANAKDDNALSFFYSIAGLFVMNSNNEGNHFEGFGLVFLEAEQFGIPVVGSAGCGIEEALEDGYNGYLTKQGDSTDIAEKLQRALENAKTLGAHSREFFTRFSWEKTVSEYIVHYKKKE